ncbi:hypothetical protein [Streptomyces sp. NPDC014656]|uniref:hypothetical protein n=1 Tax=Streptomyces sp. NPDC014656 TaxID=3364878 RepID=UPI0036FA00CD
MARVEWEQIETEAAGQPSAAMRLNRVPPGGTRAAARPAVTGAGPWHLLAGHGADDAQDELHRRRRVRPRPDGRLHDGALQQPGRGAQFFDAKEPHQLLGEQMLRVDGKRLVYLRAAKVDRLYGPSGEEEAFRFTHREKTDLPFPGVGALGDAATMVNTRCASAKASYLSVLVTVGGEAYGDVAERRKSLGAFAVDLVPEVKKAMGCTA